MPKGKKGMDLQAVIKEAVNAGIQAGRLQGQKIAGDAYKMTEKRLYAYPVLLAKIADNLETIDEYTAHGIPERSNSIARFSRSGVRLSSDEIQEAIIQDLRSKIAADQHEADIITKALQTIEADAYYEVVTMRFFDGKEDGNIAAAVHCDPSTVRRNRGRLVRRLSVWLYGAEAL